MLGTRAGRTCRGLVAALVATFVASVSHSVADGAPAPLIGIVLALLVAAPVCIALAGRRLSWVRLCTAVLLSQFVFHALLLVGVGSGTGSFAASGPHLHGAALAQAFGETSVGAGGMDHAQPVMWAAHAVAAVLTVLALGHGERAVRVLLDLAGRRALALVLAWRPLPVRRPLPTPRRAPRALRSRFALTVVQRRGPPLAA